MFFLNFFLIPSVLQTTWLEGLLSLILNLMLFKLNCLVYFYHVSLPDKLLSVFLVLFRFNCQMLVSLLHLLEF